jgi:gamma-butyrobetaine dioxygenase
MASTLDADTRVAGRAAETSMADLAPYPTMRRVGSVQWHADSVTLHWDDGLASNFAGAWLRDNCACSHCRHPQALERTFLFIEQRRPSTIGQATLADGQTLQVTFTGEDGGDHVSRYATGWLRAHDPRVEADSSAAARPRSWDGSLRDRLVTVAHDDYMNSPAGLRAWIEALNRDGIVLLRGVPQVPGQLLAVARRIGPVRASNFGEYYDVISMPNPNASAYTPMGLELHTDLANWRSPPDVQLLSCLKSSVAGGESVFADGFHVAEALREADTGAFELLCTQPFEWRFHDEGCDIRYRGPMIERDRDGALVRVRFNNWLRSARMRDPGDVAASYAALGRFWKMLRDPLNRLNIRLDPGDLIAYNNNRILHGRAPFDASTGERHLQGCYLNQEDVDSALRLLDRAKA